jgi:aspartyl-tRNA(Asn)/glutamyl-tRNA(Gln) amidotransferase subunit A
MKDYMSDLFTIPVNLAGLPGLALPYGTGGFQLIAGRFQDEALLKLGHAFELIHT